jgi:hypothetical protein
MMLLTVSPATLLRLVCAVRAAGGEVYAGPRELVRWQTPRAALSARDLQAVRELFERYAPQLSALLETEARLIRLQRNGVTWTRCGQSGDCWRIVIPRGDGTATHLELARRTGEQTCPWAIALMDAVAAGAPVLRSVEEARAAVRRAREGDRHG